MKLYHTPATCSLFPHIVLCEADLAFEIVNVDLRTKKTESGDDFLTINPKGKVPTLVLADGEILTEGVVIAQYLAEQAAPSLLPPAGTMARVRIQEWLNFLAADVHKSFAVFFQPTATETHRQAVRDNIGTHFALSEKALATHPYLVGETFTIADAYLFTILRWAPWRGIDLAPFPHLRAFQERVASRQSVRQAMEHERPSA